MEQTQLMQKLKLILQAIVNRGRRLWLFPKFVLITIQQRRRRTNVDAAEAERLDRIRNPSNYRCK